jgi:hypothetical protein
VGAILSHSFHIPFKMAYCPPSNSKWSSKTTTDDDGWKTVSSSKAKAAPAKWGQSALKKPEPKFEDEYPTISTRPAAATANAVTATTSQTGQKPLTLAERMKQKLVEEEEQKKREEEERRRKAEEAEKNQYSDEGLVFLRSRQLKLANDFKVTHSYDQDYDEHYDDEDGYAPPHEYDDGHYDNHNHYDSRYEDDRYNNFDDY